VNSLSVRGAIGADGDPVELTIVDGLFGISPEGGETFDADGLTAVPGFIDLQVNGGWGHDFTETPSSIWEVGAILPSTGVTSFCPTIITSPAERIEAAQTAMAHRPADYRGAEPLGLHVEGPFISEARRGTHPTQHLDVPPNAAFSPRHIAIVTLAPELEGALDLIRELVGAGVTVSIGHSEATADQATNALAAGARLGTHLFNAMPPISGRAPGIAGALLASQMASFGVIVDGIHLSDESVRLAWNAGRDRFVLVTDAISATGMPAGDYEIGSVQVTVADGAVRNADGNLAGSILTMPTGLANLRSITEASLSESVAAATSNPARAIGRHDIGTFADGARGDVVLLDGDSVAATIIAGSVAFQTNETHSGGI